MFDNIGSKIKNLARFFCAVGIVISVITGIILFSNGSDESEILGVVVMIGGSILSWISSFLLYGFGQLVENSDICAEIMAQQAVNRNEESKRNDKEELPEN